MFLNCCYYHALKLYCKARYLLGKMSRSEYKEQKQLIKQLLLLNPKHSIVGTGFPPWWYKASFESYFIDNKETLHQKYLCLIDGLDEKSAKTIQIIISRLMNIFQLGYGSRLMNLYIWRNLQKRLRFEATDSELPMLRQIESDFYSRIIKFPNGITAYNKLLLPRESILEPGVFYNKHFIEEVDDLQKLRNKDIIDVGAYVGDSALVLQDYTDKKVYAFEPDPKRLEKMTETIKLNNTNKIVPVAIGLSDTTEELSMKDRAFFQQEYVSIKVTTLDEWVKNSNTEVGIIKVDIEGFEQSFLRGALETIRKYKPVLLLSIYHSASDLFEIKPFIESLNLGYKFKIRRACDEYILRDTMLVCNVPEGFAITSPD